MQNGGSPAMFALVVAGRPLDTNFQPVDAKKLMAAIPQPAAVHEFTIALLQPALPPDMGVAVYYTVPGLPPPFSEWQYVGPVSLTHPTAVFRAPWHGKIPPDTPIVQLGLSVESAATLSTMQPSDTREEELAMDSAKGIATDLHNFMSSFAQSTGKYGVKEDVLVIPTDCVDRWYKKFEAKAKREPFFWMRKDTGTR